MKSFAEKLISLKGKTIQNVTAEFDEKNDGGNPVVLYFTDGTEMEFFPTVIFHGNEEYSAAAIIQIE